MFDFDAGKLLIIGVIALIVIGPKELPRVLRQVGQAVGRVRRMAGQFQGQFMDAMKEADIQDIRDEVAKLGSDAQFKVDFDPVRDIQSELSHAVAPLPAMTEIQAAETPALADHAHGFELPALPEVQPEAAAPSLAPAGYAPVVNGEVPETPANLHPGLVKKRKIVMLKRRAPSVLVPHDVSDRTSAARVRAARPRRREAIEP